MLLKVHKYTKVQVSGESKGEAAASDFVAEIWAELCSQRSSQQAQSKSVVAN